MKKLICLHFALLVFVFSYGQKGELHIEQDEKIEELLELYKSALSTTEYYRVQIGFSNNDEKAQRLKSNVEIDFPNLPSRIDFASPTWRVKVGKFKTKLEAERMYNRIRVKYPNSMLLKPEKSAK